jgi:hypothetical protein
MKKQMVAIAAMSTALAIGFASPASARDCFIASRSETGNANATHSARWITVTVQDFANSPEFPPGADPDCFVEYWLAQGGPEGFTVRSDKVIGEGSSNPNLGNGKGLDYIEVAFGPLLGAALAACPG